MQWSTIPTIFAAALVGACLAQSDTVTISGRLISVDGTLLAGDVQVIAGMRHVQVWSALADAQGSFSVRAPAYDRLLVVAKADGYISVEREIMPKGFRELRADFVLPAAVPLRVVVTDRQGLPVAGASVRVRYPGEVRWLVFDQESGPQATDEWGQCTLRVAQARPFVVEAVCGGWLPEFSSLLTHVGATMEPVVVRLRRAGQTVRVKAVGAAGPNPGGAMIRLQAAADREEGYTSEDRRSRTFRDAVNRLAFAGPEGVVEFTGVPAGRVVVVAGRPGGKLVKVEGAVERGRDLELLVTVP